MCFLIEGLLGIIFKYELFSFFAYKSYWLFFCIEDQQLLIKNLNVAFSWELIFRLSVSALPRRLPYPVNEIHFIWEKGQHQHCSTTCKKLWKSMITTQSKLNKKRLQSATTRHQLLVHFQGFGNSTPQLPPNLLFIPSRQSTCGWVATATATPTFSQGIMHPLSEPGELHVCPQLRQNADDDQHYHDDEMNQPLVCNVLLRDMCVCVQWI